MMLLRNDRERFATSIDENENETLFEPIFQHEAFLEDFSESVCFEFSTRKWLNLILILRYIKKVSIFMCNE